MERLRGRSGTALHEGRAAHQRDALLGVGLDPRVDALLRRAPAQSAGGGEARQLTHFKDFDVKFPSLGDRAIAFECGGWVYTFALDSEECRKVPVRILEDRAIARGKLHDPSKEITNYEISPDGSRALFGAHGDVFTVPASTAPPTRNLTATPGVHERGAKWSPDGKSLLLTGLSGTYVLPVSTGRGLPVVPDGGFLSDEDLAKAPGVLFIDSDDVAFGPTTGVYAFSRETVQRNLYRVPLP